jgi:hypothetical protein
LGDFLADQHEQLPISGLLRSPMTNSTPRKQVGTIADIGAVFVAPTDKLQVTDLGFHGLVRTEESEIPACKANADWAVG